MSTLFIDDEDDARASVLWANGEPAADATNGTRRLDVERVTFRWLRRGDGPGEDMIIWDREAPLIAIVRADQCGTRPRAD
jgi:hypothetical protein